ncbi:MAG: DUF4276 family protein [Planctomycetes bacterium]|nr:DUF4276 family protein [Planctomycetota bacterium]
MSPRRLILFVEGEGDQGAVAALTKKLIRHIDAWEAIVLGTNAFKVGGVENLTGRNTTKWHNWLRAAVKQKNVGGILLVLDGDRDHVWIGQEKQPFCAAVVARHLAEQARKVGAGSTFSVACVFARQEFESWLLAGIESLCGKKLPDGRAGVRDSARLSEQDTDESPRDAKKWLSQNMERGYKPSTDQEPLAQLVTLEAIRACGPRSFRRFERAVREICEAIRSGDHVATPAPQ